MKTTYAPMGLPVVGEDIMTRAVQWYENLGSIDVSIQESSTFVFEFLVTVSASSRLMEQQRRHADSFCRFEVPT